MDGGSGDAVPAAADTAAADALEAPGPSQPSPPNAVAGQASESQTPVAPAPSSDADAGPLEAKPGVATASVTTSADAGPEAPPDHALDPVPPAVPIETHVEPAAAASSTSIPLADIAAENATAQPASLDTVHPRPQDAKPAESVEPPAVGGNEVPSQAVSMVGRKPSDAPSKSRIPTRAPSKRDSKKESKDVPLPMEPLPVEKKSEAERWSAIKELEKKKIALRRARQAEDMRRLEAMQSSVEELRKRHEEEKEKKRQEVLTRIQERDKQRLEQQQERKMKEAAVLKAISEVHKSREEFDRQQVHAVLPPLDARRRKYYEPAQQKQQQQVGEPSVQPPRKGVADFEKPLFARLEAQFKAREVAEQEKVRQVIKKMKERYRPPDYEEMKAREKEILERLELAERQKKLEREAKLREELERVPDVINVYKGRTRAKVEQEIEERKKQQQDQEEAIRRRMDRKQQYAKLVREVFRPMKKDGQEEGYGQSAAAVKARAFKAERRLMRDLAAGDPPGAAHREPGERGRHRRPSSRSRSRSSSRSSRSSPGKHEQRSHSRDSSTSSKGHRHTKKEKGIKADTGQKRPEKRPEKSWHGENHAEDLGLPPIVEKGTVLRPLSDTAVQRPNDRYGKQREESPAQQPSQAWVAQPTLDESAGADATTKAVISVIGELLVEVQRELGESSVQVEVQRELGESSVQEHKLHEPASDRPSSRNSSHTSESIQSTNQTAALDDGPQLDRDRVLSLLRLKKEREKDIQAPKKPPKKPRVPVVERKKVVTEEIPLPPAPAKKPRPPAAPRPAGPKRPKPASPSPKAPSKRAQLKQLLHQDGQGAEDPKASNDLDDALLDLADDDDAALQSYLHAFRTKLAVLEAES